MFDLNEVVAGCKKQNSRAQKQLYDKYAGVLLGICMRYAHDRGEAEDILQEGFIKIFASIDDYSGSGSFEGWMKKIVANTAITYFHKHQKHHQYDDIDEVRDDEAQVNLTPLNEMAASELVSLINRMPEGYRLVFNMYVIEGYKHKEIGEQLNIDENTSKSQFLRARNWLKKELEKLGEGIDD